MEYKHDHHNVHLIVDHLIGCPRRRRKVLLGKGHDRLQQFIQEAAHKHHWSIIELAIQPDHVHLVICSTPNTLPTAMARLIKGRSAKTLREEFPVLKRLSSLWTRSAWSPIVGHVSSAIIEQYLERQFTS